MGRVTERRKVIRIRDGAVSTRPDTLVAEEPLEIRLNGKPLAITMRTPGDDFALAAGFLVSEGVLGEADELQNIVYCAGATVDGSNTYNIVDVRTAPGVVIPDISLERNVYTTSSCGLCGKASLDAVRTTARWAIDDTKGDTTPPVRLEPELLASLPDRLRAAQQVFDRTGGLHAAALFTEEGELVDIREDVGQAQRGGQAGRPRPAERHAPALPDGPAGLGAGLLRAGAEGGDGGHPGARGGLGPVVPGGRPGGGDRPDPGRLPARRLHERVRG